jgi:hypothetical protein
MSNCTSRARGYTGPRPSAAPTVLDIPDISATQECLHPDDRAGSEQANAKSPASEQTRHTSRTVYRRHERANLLDKLTG